MCGLSGFIGIPKAQAWAVVYGLGGGIDDRGGHAAGYTSVKNGKISNVRKIGEWSRASRRFLRGAAKADICMMHARFATCGIKESVDHAHPFEITRNGATELYGAHNGIIYDGAEESAKLHGREYTVDSREVFELLADGKLNAIQRLDGYGVLTWIVPGSDYVNMVRLSDHSEIAVVQLKAGGHVWASTSSILYEALDLACLKVKTSYTLDQVGMVYQIRKDMVYESHVTDLHLSKFSKRKAWYTPDEEPQSWETIMLERYREEIEEVERKTDPSLYSSWERDLEEYPSIANTYE